MQCWWEWCLKWLCDCLWVEKLHWNVMSITNAHWRFFCVQSLGFHSLGSPKKELNSSNVPFPSMCMRLSLQKSMPWTPNTELSYEFYTITNKNNTSWNQSTICVKGQQILLSSSIVLVLWPWTTTPECNVVSTHAEQHNRALHPLQSSEFHSRHLMLPLKILPRTNISQDKVIMKGKKKYCGIHNTAE